MRSWTNVPGVRGGIVVAFCVATLFSFFPAVASAQVPDQTIVRLDNLNQNTASTGSVCITPHNTYTTSVASVLVTFPTAFTIVSASPSTNWAATDSPPGSLGTGQDYWPSGAHNWPQATLTPTVPGSAQTVKWSFTASTMTAANMYCMRWTALTGLTSTGTAGLDEVGTVTIEDGSNAVLESNEFAVTTVSTPNDTVGINATVPPIFEFALNTNSATFATALDYHSVNTSSTVKGTVTTNAPGGWIMWAKSANGGLTSSSSGGSIPTIGWSSTGLGGAPLPQALSPTVTAQDALSVVTTPAVVTKCSASNLSVDPEYDTANNPGTDGGMFTTSFAEIGTCTGDVSDGDALTMSVKVAITAITPAASDYTDTMTVVAAGNF